MPVTTLNLHLPDAGATMGLGAAIARAMPAAAMAAAVLYLRGDLGAGKTTCARSLLQALGVTGVVRSPTYALVETYPLPGLECVHADLYRLNGAADVEELGLREYLKPGHLLLIEWPERGGAALPAADIELALGYPEFGGDVHRDARLTGASESGERWLANLRKDASISPYVANIT
jgi:tRNA threonylcarbamoyladenosine biosynthesis protein TsaE